MKVSSSVWLSRPPIFWAAFLKYFGGPKTQRSTANFSRWMLVSTDQRAGRVEFTSGLSYSTA
jgi:hypothetical protein